MPTLNEIRTRSAEARKRKERFQAWQSPTWEDIDLLLSLLDSDSQAAPDYKRLAQELALVVDVGTNDDPGTALIKLRKIQSDAATAIRDKCVEKVRAMRDGSSLVSDDPFVNGVRATYNSLIAELSSLTLDQVKPEKQ